MVNQLPTAVVQPNVVTVAAANIDFTRLVYMLHMSMDMQISIADTKAQLIMGANAILIASIALNPGALSSALITADTQPVERFAVAISLLMVVALLISIYFALSSARPKLRGGTKQNNLFFFGTAAALEEAAYVEQFMALTMDDIKTSVIAQVHAKAVIVEKKYRGIRSSLLFLFIALLLWLLARLVFAL
ncbi:MAG: Pycsar system effector family protein [Aggregatilineales bacterium]